MQFLIDHLQNELDYTEEEAIKEAFEQAQKLDNECLERWPVNDKVKWSDIIGYVYYIDFHFAFHLYSYLFD